MFCFIVIHRDCRVLLFLTKVYIKQVYWHHFTNGTPTPPTALRCGCKSPPSLSVAGSEPKPSLLPQKPSRAPYGCHQGINKGFAVLCQVSEITCFFFLRQLEQHFEPSFRFFLGSPCSYPRAPWSLTITAIGDRSDPQHGWLRPCATRIMKGLDGQIGRRDARPTMRAFGEGRSPHTMSLDWSDSVVS